MFSLTLVFVFVSYSNTGITLKLLADFFYPNRWKGGVWATEETISLVVSGIALP